MSHIEDDAPAFPVPGLQHDESFNGMTLRQYAAIKLRVPESGTDWLDAMIVQSRRDEFAGNAMQAYLTQPEVSVAIRQKLLTSSDLAGSSYEWADAMIEAGKGGAK